jgi:TetR/AcrR family transcriptional regulator, regulator of cefoperazone and chloramphenicol sensitivity
MVEAGSRFRPGSQQRGEDTRRRILVTALELFATDGFEGASTRTLAERAGVNLPAIQYYFGSKEGLYRAVVEDITERMVVRVAPVSDQIRTVLADGQPSRRQLVAMLCDLLDIVISLMLDDDIPDRKSRQKFFARMEVEPNPAADFLLESMMHYVLAPAAGIVGRLVERPADDEQVLLRTMTIIGQVKIFCGWGTNRMLHLDTVSEAQVRSIQTLIREHVHAIFRSVKLG